MTAADRPAVSPKGLGRSVGAGKSADHQVLKASPSPQRFAIFCDWEQTTLRASWVPTPL